MTILAINWKMAQKCHFSGHFGPTLGKWPFLGHKLENGPKRPQNYHFWKKRKMPFFGSFWTKTGEMAILAQKWENCHFFFFFFTKLVFFVPKMGKGPFCAKNGKIAKNSGFCFTKMLFFGSKWENDHF